MSDASRQHQDKAERHVSQGRLDAALVEYQQAARAVPGDLGIHERLAELNERLGHRAQALTEYETVSLGWARAGQPLRAMVACRTLLKLEPGNARVPRSLADLYARGGVAGGARREFELIPDAEGGAASGLPAVPLFSKLDRDAFIAVLPRLEVRVVETGGSVVVEGAPGASMFVVVEGRVEVVRHLEGGVRRVVGTMGAGDFFGEMALISEGPRLASVVAAERTVLLELMRADLNGLGARHPSVLQVVQAFYRERMVANLLRSSPLFSALKPEQKDAVAREFQLRPVEPGEELLKANQMGDAFYMLLRGRCMPYHVHPDGREVAYPELREGDVFGEISLILDKPVTATVRASVPCVVLRLDRAAFEKHILSQPGMRGALMRVGTERLQRTAKLLAGARDWNDGDLRV
ncbi:cyclic nucleotide-binding domain-containing protein [Myxococcaceae bacterium GXIMD 01537]